MSATIEHSPGRELARDRRRALIEAVIAAGLLLTTVTIGTVGLLTSAMDTIRMEYGEHLVQLATAAAQNVDTGLHARLRDPAQIDTPDYARAIAPLRRLRLAVPDIKYVYTVVRDGSRVRFILDAADPGDHDGDGVEDRSGVWQLYEKPDAEMTVALGSGEAPGQATSSAEPYTDAWGTFVTGYAPFYDAAGLQAGVVGVDMDATVYMGRLSAARHQALLGLAPAVLLILSLSVVIFFGRVRALAADRQTGEARANAERAAGVLDLERTRLINVIEGTGAGTWEWNVQTNEVITNEHWAGMLGYSLAELSPVTYQTWERLVHPDDIRAAKDGLEECCSGRRTVYECDFRMRHRDGRWLWIVARGKVIQHTATGAPLWMAGTHLNITARKDASQALEDSERKFRGLFELSPVGIALNDCRTGQFLEVNEALCAPTGYSREELLALGHADLTPDFYKPQEKAHVAVMERTGSYGPYEKEYIRKDGSRYPVLLNGMHMTDASGRQVIWSIVQDISRHKAMEEELTVAASLDRLTGLANRATFVQRLQRAIDRVRAHPERRFAVLFLDFDRFKLVNDSLGHDVGDQLLQHIAQRLCQTLRTSDVMGQTDDGNLVARFGGDEFIVLMKDFHKLADAEKVAERLLNALAPAYSLAGREVHSSASIGIVTSDQCSESADAVIRNADVAMYEAKKAGRACAVVFNEAMYSRLTRHLTIESALRRALGTPQLSLVYQPIVHLTTGHVVSVEALLRWQHPDLGAITPAEFVPVAEESGLIVPLGDWVLQEACRQLAAWREEIPDHVPETISVNVARAQLGLGSQLLVRVREILAQSGLTPSCLQLEVTEREVMRDPDAVRRLMLDLQAMGVRLAMDDFGTGTSSLGCLRDFPFDTVKIDRSFVAGVQDTSDVRALIHATVTLVQNLGMASVAEGVETATQLSILKSVGCQYAQGYYFSRPLPAEELLAHLRGEKTGRHALAFS